MAQNLIFEEQRLANLLSYEILDTSREMRFDHLVHLANAICGTERSVISLIDSERQWFKARIGIDADETPRSLSFCSHTIQQNDVMEIEDARNDERFKAHPAVVSGDLRFYAGAPMTSPEGFNLGTLCVFGNKPGTLTLEQKASLKILASQAMELILLKKLNKILTEQQELLLNKARLQSIGELAGGVCHQINNPLAIIKGRAMILRYKLQDILPKDNSAFAELEMIESTTERVSNILKALRFYSKDLGNTITDVRIHEALEDAMTLVQSRISKEEVTLHFEKGPDIIVKMNKNQIVQVLVDLISNALDGLLESDVKILNVKIEKRDSKIVMTVSDSGTGIKQEEAGRIFDAFFSTKPRHFGIGLYNAKNFISQHNGEIKLLSLKSPTTFEVTI
jgi:signal transduction histidine kinase